MKRIITTLAAIALATPSIASAEPAAKALSLSNAAVQPVRASAPMARKKLKAEGSGSGTIVAGVAGVLIVVGALCATDVICGDDNDPDSP